MEKKMLEALKKAIKLKSNFPGSGVVTNETKREITVYGIFKKGAERSKIFKY